MPPFNLSLGIELGGVAMSQGGRLVMTKPLNVLVIGDSQAAGRGAGTGSVQMDGARVLSWPTKLRDQLIADGYAASSESFAEAANTGGSLPLYDPRVSLGGWTVATSGTGTSGKLLLNNSGGTVFSYTPSTPVDTFRIYTPRESYGNINFNIDGGSPTSIVEGGGTSAFDVTEVTTSLGTHTINMQRANPPAGTVYLCYIQAFNSAANDFRIVNNAARGYSTTDWLVQDKPWRAFPGILKAAPDISLIALGVNDLRTGGAGNSLATFTANMQTLIDQCKTGGKRVGLVLPMPVDTASEGSFTQAQMLAAYQSLAASNGIPLYRTDLLLGDWSSANANGQVSDNLHWKAAASASLGAALSPFVQNLAKGL